MRLVRLIELTLVNVGKDTTLGDGNVAEKLVQLLVVADGELKVTRDDTGLLVVAGSVAGQLEDLSSQVLKDSGEVDGSTCEIGSDDCAQADASDRDGLPAPTRCA